MKTLLLLLASTSLSLAGGIREKRQSYYNRGGGSGYGGNNYGQGRADVQVDYKYISRIPTPCLVKWSY